VPLDGSALSESAIPLALSLAGSDSPQYVFASVVRPTSSQTGLAEGQSHQWHSTEEIVPGVLSESQEPNARYLEGIAGRFPDVYPLLVVGVGDAATEIDRIAGELGVDLVVIASRGRSGMVRGLLGSVTDRLLQISTRPILVTRSGVEELRASGPREINSLIIPLDGSELSERAIPYGGQLATKLGIPVNLIRCVRYPTLYSGGDEIGFEPGLLISMTELEAVAAEYLDAHAQTLVAAGVAVNCKVEAGHPRNRVIELANQVPDSLIVMTSHGSTGLTRWALGSVADGLLRAGTAPTLILPQRKMT